MKIIGISRDIRVIEIFVCELELLSNSLKLFLVSDSLLLCNSSLLLLSLLLNLGESCFLSKPLLLLN